MVYGAKEPHPVKSGMIFGRLAIVRRNLGYQPIIFIYMRTIARNPAVGIAVSVNGMRGSLQHARKALGVFWVNSNRKLSQTSLGKGWQGR